MMPDLVPRLCSGHFLAEARSDSQSHQNSRTIQKKEVFLTSFLRDARLGFTIRYYLYLLKEAHMH